MMTKKRRRENPPVTRPAPATPAPEPPLTPRENSGTMMPDFASRDVGLQGTEDQAAAVPHHSPHVAPPSAAGGAFDDLDGLFPTVTPGLVISMLTPPRARALAECLDLPRDVEGSGGSARAERAQTTRRLLAQLNDAELRRLAAHVGLATDGKFMSLYHRLALLC
jgi:hypothetical protein